MKKEDNTTPEERYLVPAVEQASRILFCLAGARNSRMGLIEICTQVGIHKSKAFSILRTLQKFGLIQRSSEGKGYSLGPGLIGLSRRFLDNLDAPSLAEPFLQELARKTGATAALGLIADKNVFVAAKHEANAAYALTMRVGHRFPLTYGCHGKAIAAFMPEDEFKSLLEDKKLYFQGNRKALDRDKLMADIERCRQEWFAEDLEETEPGLNAVASPVLGPHGRPIGYIVVLGLLTSEAARQCGPLVAEAGKALSRQLGAKVDA
ncbi:MAG: Transcriptional regulator KdgR [Syntrophorhabdaceae bacterium PtaU1.Bin034]|jgi:DNA-binding IclR family transcriptional regulator|nr:MAG: Transcriptional regulator KdgR [Syntrophorhabdaceae bacterium PtaU1.Bin034]